MKPIGYVLHNLMDVFFLQVLAPQAAQHTRTLLVDPKTGKKTTKSNKSQQKTKNSYLAVAQLRSAADAKYIILIFYIWQGAYLKMPGKIQKS